MILDENSKQPADNKTGSPPAEPDPEEAIDPVWLVYFDGRPMQTSRAACGYSIEEWQSGGKEFIKRNLTPDSVDRFKVTQELDHL